MLLRVIDPVEVESGCIDLEDTVPFSWSSIPDFIVKDINQDYKTKMIEVTKKGELKEKDVLLLEQVEELGDCNISFEWKTDIIGFEDDLL